MQAQNGSEHCVTPTTLREFDSPVIRDLLAQRPQLAAESVDGGGFASESHLKSVVATLDKLGVEDELVECAILYCASQLGCVFTLGTTELFRTLEKIDALEDAYGAAGYSDAEGLRRLLLAMVEDVRALLIILADRLVKLRAAVDAPEPERLAFTRRIQAIHAPLANRLGIWQFKWELEDLVFRYTQTPLYHRIARLIDERRADRERYIDSMVALLNAEIEDSGLVGDVKGRPKHIFSIWRKMQKKQLSFDQLYDIRAVRVLVESVADCYAVLGMVHGLWQPIPGEFDDYIANPKPNGYQSLHTAVFGPQGKPVEIQIRTRQMHEHAELGVAAHWRYKEGGGHDPAFQRKLNQMRHLIERGADDEGLLEDFSIDDDDRRVYVLTPNGKVVDLRQGSTVLDFAYHVHTDIGHRCKGAKVNGRIVPLTHQVSNGEQVEILTARAPAPSRDWMVAKLGYLATPRARSKVRQWFKKFDFEQNVADGRHLLDRELRRLALKDSDLGRLAARFNKTGADGVLAAIGQGEITAGQVAAALQPDREEPTQTLDIVADAGGETETSSSILIEGVGNLLSTIAKCCSPVPGDSIVGYLTRTRGVSIHREDCKSVARAIDQDPNRVMTVAWGGQKSVDYKAEISVLAYDRPGLVADIGQLFSALKVQLLGIQSSSDESRGEAHLKISLRVSDYEQLSFVLTRVGGLRGVFEAKRSA